MENPSMKRVDGFKETQADAHKGKEGKREGLVSVVRVDQND